jgi:branched-chain amino acid transport system permease protein
MTIPGPGRIALAAVVALILIVPMVQASEETLNLVSLIVIWSLFAVGFDFVFGVGGMLSFGHAAMFGTGGYALVLLVTKSGIGFMPALVAAGAVGGVIALGLSFFALRVSGLFFSLSTLALAQLVYILAGSKLRAYTGGLDGIPGVPRPALLGIDFYNNRNYYYFVVAVFLVGLAVMALLRSSPFGKALKAVQANDVRAAQLGFNVQRLRQCAFVISGFYAGVSGALLASLLFYISPQMLHWSTSGDVLVMTVLGGKATLLGPILGVAVFEFLKEKLGEVTEHWYGVLGVIFIACTILLPNGLAGFFAGRGAERAGKSP